MVCAAFRAARWHGIREWYGLLYGINAIGMVLIGVGGLTFRPLRSAETLRPDYDDQIDQSQQREAEKLKD